DAIVDEPAVDALLRLFRDDAALELVAIGPLTNLAVALERDPSFARRVARLTVMGGWLRGALVGGNLLPPSVDYNLCSDPVAAERVLSSGIPTRLISADATVQVWLTDADVAVLEDARAPLQRALARAMRIWAPVQQRLFAGVGAPPEPRNAAFLHDPLALACVHDESFCTMEELAIEPAIVDGVFRSLLRPAGASGSFVMRCATAVDAPRFTAHVRRRLGVAEGTCPRSTWWGSAGRHEQRANLRRQALWPAVVVHQCVLGLPGGHALPAARDLVRERDARAADRPHPAADLQLVVVARRTAVATGGGHDGEVEP